MDAKQQAKIIRESRDTFATHKSKTPDEQALLAYEPLDKSKRQAYKAEAAQILAACLERRFRPGKLPRNQVPAYLVGAIDFVTRNVGTGGATDAP